ncbi:unnamed protein product, partial [Ectocarpus sp. 12 AP-2014]
NVRVFFFFSFLCARFILVCTLALSVSAVLAWMMKVRLSVGIARGGWSSRKGGEDEDIAMSRLGFICFGKRVAQDDAEPGEGRRFCFPHQDKRTAAAPGCLNPFTGKRHNREGTGCSLFVL